MLQKNRIILVFGSPGAGKTTVITKSIGNNAAYQIINIGTLMKDIAMNRGYVSDRDVVRYLPIKIATAIRKTAIGQIEKMQGNIVIDTHVSVERGNRYFPGMPLDAISRLTGVAGIIYIDAKTADIIKRRKNDKNRKREMESASTIDLQRSINIAMISAISAHLNISIYIIENNEGMLQAAEKSFKAALEDIMKEYK